MSDHPAEERIDHEEVERVISYLRQYGEQRQWPRLRECADVVEALLTEHFAREEQLSRAVYLAKNLLGMIPGQVWRDQGGDDGQGHYEGDYYAERVATELDELAASLPATESAQPEEELTRHPAEETREHVTDESGKCWCDPITDVVQPEEDT